MNAKLGGRRCGPVWYFVINVLSDPSSNQNLLGNTDQRTTRL